MRQLWWMTALAVMVGVTAASAAPLIDVGVGTATGMSTDGSVVALNNSGAYIWNYYKGLKSLGAAYTSGGVAVGGSSFFGSSKVIVGASSGGNVYYWAGDVDGTGSWSAALGLGTALCTSANAAGTDFWIGGNNGTTTGSREAIRYKRSSNSLTALNRPAGYNRDAYIYGVSDIGSYAGRAQYGNTSPSGARGAVGGGTLAGLNPLIGAQTTSNEAVANAISRNGARAGGWSTNTGVQRQGTIWNIGTATPVVAIPFLGTDNYAEVQALNSDGTIAAGYARDLVAGTRRLWIWDAVNGTQDLAAYLTGLGWDLTGWTFTDVKGMSADGRRLTGTGTFEGVTHTWFVPEPATMLMLALGGLALRRRR